MPNFFWTVLRFFKKIMNLFQIHHNFQLAYILSFQKRYICPKKILDIKKFTVKNVIQIFQFYRTGFLIFHRNPVRCNDDVLHDISTENSDNFPAILPENPVRLQKLIGKAQVRIPRWSLFNIFFLTQLSIKYAQLSIRIGFDSKQLQIV